MVGKPKDERYIQTVMILYVNDGVDRCHRHVDDGTCITNGFQAKNLERISFWQCGNNQLSKFRRNNNHFVSKS